MAATAFLALLQAVRGALLADPAVAAGRVRVGQRVALPQEWPDGVNLSLVSARAQRATTAGAAMWQTVLAVDLLARGDLAAQGEAALDPLLADVYGRLADLSTVPGVGALEIEPDLDWDVTEADTPITRARLQLRAIHHTAAGTLLPA